MDEIPLTRRDATLSPIGGEGRGEGAFVRLCFRNGHCEFDKRFLASSTCSAFSGIVATLEYKLAAS